RQWHLSPGGEAAAEVAGRAVRLRDARTGEVFHLLTGPRRDVLGVAFSPDGSVLAAANGDGVVWVWGVATGEPLRVLDARGKAGRVSWLVFSPDGSRLLTGEGGLLVHLWDVGTGRHLGTMRGNPDHHPRHVLTEGNWECCFAPAGKALFTSNNGHFQVWEVAA